MLKVSPFIIKGAFVTLKYALSALFCGLPLGIFLAINKINSGFLLKMLSDAYTSIFRGTPLFVQFSLIYYASPQLFGWKPTPFEAGLLTFSLNSAAYSSEVIRAGIASIPSGQWDAARVLGLTKSQTWRYIVMPQALRTSLPALVNEMINLIKESAIVSFVGEMDLMRRAQIIAAEKFIFFEPYIITACVYFSLVMIFSFFGRFLERRYVICQ